MQVRLLSSPHEIFLLVVIKMKYKKLVRDKIPEIIKKNEPKNEIFFHIADDNEYWKELKQKLLEEVNEYLKSETIEEMSDIEEVLKTIRDFKNISVEKVEKIQREKLEKRGGFQKKIILDEVRRGSKG